MEGLAADETALVLHLRPSRRRARAVAVAEVATVLEDLGGRPLPGGPLSEVPGVAWVAVGPAPPARIAARLARLGYTEAVERVVPAGELEGEPEPAWTRARWRGGDVVLVPVHAEPAEALRAEAPDRRSFLLECGDGVTRRIAGYRGGRGPLEHRALPPADARLLVNLVARPASGGGVLLDPFAGAGGVVVAAARAGWTTVSADVDPALRPGLAELSGGRHLVADAAALPLAAGTVDAIATEPPYHGSATASVVAAVAEVARVGRPGARVAMLVATAQAPAVRAAAGRSGLAVDLDVAIDRKGTDVTCLRMVCGRAP
jgi:hypothetical protein